MPKSGDASTVLSNSEDEFIRQFYGASMRTIHKNDAILDSFEERYKYTENLFNKKAKDDEKPMNAASLKKVFELSKEIEGWRSSRALYYQFVKRITLWGTLIDWYVAAQVRFWLVLGLTAANLLSTFLTLHVTRWATDDYDPPADVITGLQHLFKGLGILLIIALIVYEVPRFYHHYGPRSISKVTSSKSDCISRYLDRLDKQSRIARRNEAIFNYIMSKDKRWDSEARTYRFRYDPENDNPIIASVYFHLEEEEEMKEKTVEPEDDSTQHRRSSKHKKEVTAINNTTGGIRHRKNKDEGSV